MAAVEPAFTTFRRGEIRELILRHFRAGLRQLLNPKTGTFFTEDEIRLATVKDGRFWREADAIDLAGMAHQKRDEYLAEQIPIDRAAEPYLVGVHGRMWGETPLPATGGFGQVLALATPGTIFLGSTTVPDDLAHYCTDPAGLRYQVYIGGTVPGSGQIALTLQAIDTGDQTNVPTGTVFTWANPPAGAQPEATATEDFSGGTQKESNEDFALRLLARIRHKPAAGNWAHFRDWARRATNAVEDAFVYPTALHAGTTVVAITQKRAGVAGPSARVANAVVLAAVRAYLTPPGSPVTPGHPHVLVVTVTTESADGVLGLDMRKGSASGWADADPWPKAGGAQPAGVEISSVTSQSIFQVDSAVAPPTVGTPRIMVWDEASSSFEELDVDVITPIGGDIYEIELTAPAATTLVVGMHVSPFTERRAAIQQAITAYFDSLGPGELVDLATDFRGTRAFRHPIPSEERPQRVGHPLVITIADALGAALSDASVISLSPETPTVPSDPVTGPRMLVAGEFGVYSLT